MDDVLPGLVGIFLLLLVFRRHCKRALLRWMESGGARNDEELAAIIAHEKQCMRAKATGKAAVDWYRLAGKYHQRTLEHDGKLAALPAEWQRELAALWRLEADVNNGGYLQFLANWGRDSYVYASQALKNIGAGKMTALVDRCQALVDEHFVPTGKAGDERRQLLPNPTIGPHGEVVQSAGSALPEAVVARIHKLSTDFVSYPEDVAALGLRYYRPHIDRDRSADPGAASDPGDE